MRETVGHFVELALNGTDALTQETLVHFDLLLAHAFDGLVAATAAHLALQMRPHPCQSRQLILILRQLDLVFLTHASHSCVTHPNLQLAFATQSTLREDVQNQRRPIADSHSFAKNVALLEQSPRQRDTQTRGFFRCS